MNKRLRLFCTMLLMVVMACGLSITANAATNLGSNGLCYPNEGAGTYTDTNGQDSITVAYASNKCTVTLNDATIENIDQAINFYGMKHHLHKKRQYSNQCYMQKFHPQW